MASDQTLRAVITVLDRTVEPLHQLNARFTALGAPLREIGSRVSALAEETGLKTIGEHAGEAFAKVQELGKSLLEATGVLGTLGAAGSVAGLLDMAKDAAEYGEKLDIASHLTGIATQQLAGWHYAAGLVNLDVGQMDRGFTFLNRNISEAASGKAKDVERIFTGMGLTNAPGHLVSTATALKTVAAEVQALVGSGKIQLATDVMDKLFGARSGAMLLPLFEKGPAELAKIMAQAKESGLSLTAAQTESGTAFMDSFKRMSASVEGLKISIGNELLPVLTPIIDGMRKWLDANRQWLATKIGDAVRGIAADLKGIDWHGIVADIKGIAHAAEWVVREVGGIGMATAGVVAIRLGPLILAWSKLGGSIAWAAGKLVLFPAAQAVASLASLLPAVTSARDVWAAFSLVLDANPLGAAVIAITALAAGLYEIYEHWKRIVSVVKEVKGLLGFHDREPAPRPASSPPGGHKGERPAAAPGAHAEPLRAVGQAKHLPFAHADLLRRLREEHQQHAQLLPNFHAEQMRAAREERRVAAAHAARLHALREGPPRFGMQPPLSTLPGAPAAAGAAVAPKGETKMTIDFKNMPRGTALSTVSRGTATPPQVDVGYAMAY